MKWKVVIILLILAILGLVGIIKYYGFEWKVLADISFYENLANPSIRIVKIGEGLRKEQIAKTISDKLNWSEKDIQKFENAKLAVNIENPEGYYFPKSYMLLKDADPDTVSQTMFSEFQKETNKIIKGKNSKVINQDTAVKVASIIQRESGGKSDMRLISGIIWNRIFKGMKLQMDATLQYAKGNEEDGWWPTVEPEDKNIDSPYNTYKYFSLPPSPIASPGISALDAAYNPLKTDCLYYIHDKKGKIHCSPTYEGHKRNIEKYY